MAHKKIVHIVGTGTIGEPLVGILSTFREKFGIDEVTFHKRTPLLTDRSKVIVSCKNGAKLAVDKERRQQFIDMGMKPSYEAEEASEPASSSIAPRWETKTRKNFTISTLITAAVLSLREVKTASVRSTPGESTI